MGESESKPPWNSWEDLILVCLVQRHGLESWETVSMELKSRVDHSQGPSRPPEFFTPQECMHRFPILHQRFLATRESSDDNDGFEKMIKSMKAEYTTLRIQTLKRELETRDMNIKLLEQKLERLEREKEEGGDLRTMANEVVVKANEDGDDEPSSKMDSGDN